LEFNNREKTQGLRPAPEKGKKAKNNLWQKIK
jgi:hypothetical protein